MRNKATVHLSITNDNILVALLNIVSKEHSLRYEPILRICEWAKHTPAILSNIAVIADTECIKTVKLP